MKYILLLIIFAGCTKSDSNKPSKCYECITSYSGSGAPPQTYNICTDRIDTVHFQDANGNQLGHTCTEK